MAKLPPQILYGPNDKVPWTTLILQGIQHAATMSSTLVLPAIVIAVIHGSGAEAEALLQVSILVLGIGSILLTLRFMFIGCGYLCPQLLAPGYLSAAILAVKTGGISLLFGMTIIAGIFQSILSFLIPLMRQFFPIEVSGTVVMMIGITLIVPGIENILSDPHVASTAHLAWRGLPIMTAAISLALMVGLSIWGSIFNRYGLIIGVIVGMILGLSLHLYPADLMQGFHQSSWFALPHVTGFLHLSFSWGLIVPFLIASLCVTLKSMGNIITCQKINDVEWSVPDLNNVRNGSFTNGLTTILAGLLGGMAGSPSASNIGLSAATGITSRFIAMCAGVIFIIIAFLPKVAFIFILIPKPVQGSILLFVASFMITAGIQVISVKNMDIRRVFVVGISLISGIVFLTAPLTLLDSLPNFLTPILDSPLAVTTVMAFILNGLFRIGITKTARINITHSNKMLAELWAFIEEKGMFWSAVAATSKRAAQASSECMEAIYAQGMVKKAKIIVSFDDFSLVVKLRYRGEMLDLTASKPDRDAILRDPKALANLSIVMMQEYADKVTIRKKGKECLVTILIKQ